MDGRIDQAIPVPKCHLGLRTNLAPPNSNATSADISPFQAPKEIYALLMFASSSFAFSLTAM